MMPVRHRISYILRELEVEDQHRFGINDLAVSQDGSKLFSAGRDGIARQWNVSNRSNVQYHSQYNNHVDWINAVALCEDIGFLVTASSDSTLKVWTLNKGLLAATLNKVNAACVSAHLLEHTARLRCGDPRSLSHAIV
eukprot:TRINITY_DN8907_c0_g1_i6.p1 TRINITY_DN8907_c0_g1~~TRINITY_DN8907_c0_g1_i6.p1  ORF type:complete len:138 (+),score=19.22 TRINITY_DN8907_c0_g1_i6:223-636(+)